MAGISNIFTFDQKPTRSAIMVDVKSDPNCVEPACKSKVDMFKSFMGGKGPAAGSKAQQQQQQTKSETPAMPADCPLGREELGNATWGLVRT